MIQSFLSAEKDTELIFSKLFGGDINNDGTPDNYALRKLLVIPDKDCLDDKYNDKVADYGFRKLYSEYYISNIPKLKFVENEQIKSAIILRIGQYDVSIENPQYRHNTITFDIISHLDTWDIGDYRVRPLKIAGYIDSILTGKNTGNKKIDKHLTGIGEIEFLSCNSLVIDENFAGYSLTYLVTHGNDDKLTEA